MNARTVAVGIILGSAVACTREAATPDPASPPSATAPAASARPTAADPALDDALVGTTVPEWTAEEWLNGPPLKLAGLHGRVVLVRWFTGTSCPHCSATAPSLNALHHEYATKGLTVVGMYHHKEEAPLKPGEVAGFAKTYGFEFPVAIDTEWTTLKKWWLVVPDRPFTSVSFLLDRQGRVRGIHPGGRYVVGDADYAAMKRGIEKLLAER
jgi:peroxiredoxin